MTITYTVPQDARTYNTAKSVRTMRSVTDVLADASGGPDVPAGRPTAARTPAQIAAENADDDLFFCAARATTWHRCSSPR